MKWHVHRLGDKWCAHVGPRGKPNYRFDSWGEAFFFAFAQAALARMEVLVS